MIDQRFHVISLIAVFLALGIGVVLGGALNSPESQLRLMGRLSAEMDQLRKEDQQVRLENQRLTQWLDAREKAEQELLPLAVAGRLSGSRVAVLLCGPWDDRPFWAQLESALKLSGATIESVTVVPDELQPLPGEASVRFASTWPDDKYEATAPYAPVRWLVRALHDGGYGQRIEELGKLTGIRTDPATHYSEPVRRVLIVSSARPERSVRLANSDVPEIALLESATALGMRVVICQPNSTGLQNGETAPLQVLRGRGAPTVDNIDTTVGHIAAVLALAGQDGDFGTVAAPLPPLTNR